MAQGAGGAKNFYNKVKKFKIQTETKIDKEKTKILNSVQDRTVWNPEKFALVAATYKNEVKKANKKLLE